MCLAKWTYIWDGDNGLMLSSLTNWTGTEYLITLPIWLLQMFEAESPDSAF